MSYSWKHVGDHTCEEGRPRENSLRAILHTCAGGVWPRRSCFLCGSQMLPLTHTLAAALPAVPAMIGHIPGVWVLAPGALPRPDGFSVSESTLVHHAANINY